MKASANKQISSDWSKQVEAACAGQGLQLTPLRHRVLSILCGNSTPLGAYAILEKLSQAEGKQVAPQTVYRALEFFIENRFLHKIESRNVYAPCKHVGFAHHAALLLCKKCGRSEEIEDGTIDNLLKETALKAGFLLHRQILELQGVCKSCSNNWSGIVNVVSTGVYRDG